MFNTLIPLLLLLSILATTVGGYLDMTHQENLYGITSRHAWNDGLFLLLLAIALLLLSRNYRK